MANLGGAYKLSLGGTQPTKVELGAIAGIPKGGLVRQLTILAPGPQSATPNTKPVYVGPNGMAVFELIPGAATDVTDTDPALIQVDCLQGNTAVVYILVGGAPVVMTAPLDRLRPA